MNILKTAGVLAVLLMATSVQADERQELREQDKLSYSIGMDVARNFKKSDVPLDADMVMLGIKNGLANERPLLSEREFRKVIGEFQLQTRQRTAANIRVLTAENRKQSAEFLQNNKSKDGVVTLSGGLQYKVLQAGQGALPKDSDTVILNYRGSLLDGTQFDSTEPGKPGKANLYDLFNGLRAGVKQMAVGSHWTLWIPPQLAYGERGVGNDIGPNALLVYDVELVGIGKSPQ
ncbi:FKBP-type peptidyl-prolyl cis-trans isomerase [Actimicrobium sp. CCI2.3]|uniref:FKBP-type peptidyl-prolyl cis-trans isomerase n=1 Tax=Actimicrobium sp. CCI2.3 TaxID=3048616 RepID=UPI002AB3FC5A|nr:FKBP-type peptidyl-prolyl cis-trans isomerase [Actimicrobium sp. CCI2.3]MDY7574586.1 FKBP-type peptidyl-prolyl cis-trans isomerase [Actimicrobium sp. CCI2.3]MEB0020962.1 FKBP-type peptidyl-prolyl cis-trans isomerase [Actimicrobium sp. CCI2.3]